MPNIFKCHWLPLLISSIILVGEKHNKVKICICTSFQCHWCKSQLYFGPPKASYILPIQDKTSKQHKFCESINSTDAFWTLMTCIRSIVIKSNRTILMRLSVDQTSMHIGCVVHFCWNHISMLDAARSRKMPSSAWPYCRPHVFANGMSHCHKNLTRITEGVYLMGTI